MSSFRLWKPRRNQSASIQNTALPPVSMETPADSRTQTHSRLPRPTTQLRAYATQLPSSVTVSVWLQRAAPARHLVVRRGTGLVAGLAQTWVPDGKPAAFLVLVPEHGNASTRLVILKVVRACSTLFRKYAYTDVFVACEGGGCMFPLTAYSPIGEDCSTLPGVADVSCLGGKCVVPRCLPGYVLALASGRHELHPPQAPHSESRFDYAEDVPARVYGLKHIPLGQY